jgi:branched-chain amino acid transport system ATP-binding protein
MTHCLDPASAVSDAAPSVLALSHVNASYGPYRALFDLSFRIPAGTVTALLGSNGSGKSTVARVVTGLLQPTSGTIHIGISDITSTSAHQIARLGVAHVPEGRGIFASLTVEENLTLVFRQRAGRRRVRDSLAKAYDAFPALKEQCHKRAGNLSGGQQRLLSLATVMIVPPTLLVADELSLGLAPVVVDTIYEGLRKIHKAGTSLLIVEQQVDRVLDIADQAVVLDCGAVAYDGPAQAASVAIDRILASRGERNKFSSAKSRSTGHDGIDFPPRQDSPTLGNGCSHE